MTKPLLLKKKQRVRFTPMTENYPKGAAGMVFIFDSVDYSRDGSFDHRLVNEEGTFMLWADRIELRKMPEKERI